MYAISHMNGLVENSWTFTLINNKCSIIAYRAIVEVLISQKLNGI